MDEETKFWVKTMSIVVAGIIILITVWMAGMPQYRVYRQRLQGEAELAHAHSARMILVTQAEAEKEAAQKRADAIQIVGKAAKEFPEYRTQEFIGAFAEALREGKINQIMYVPTEANIPITEAHRLAPSK